VGEVVSEERAGGPEDWLNRTYFRVSGLGSRESGTGYQVRVRVRVLNLHLYLNTWTRDLTAETRDLRTNSLLRMRCHRIPTRDSATWGQTRSAFRTKSDPVALPPRIEFEFHNLGAGEAEKTFADFEAVEIGTELAGGCGQGLAEMIEGHGSVAGDLTRGIGRE